LFEDFRDSSLICSIAALFGRVSLYARLTECPTFDDLFLAIIGGELDMVKHIYARCFSKKKMPIALACLALRNNHTHILNWMFEIGYLDRIGYTSNARFVYKDAAMYGAEWSMRWILDLPNVVVPIEYRMYSLISPRWLSKMNGRWINNIFYDMRDGEFRELARWTREPTNIIPECGEFVVDDWSFITTPVAYAYISNIPNVKLY
jgi:hypothetical protein